MARKPLLIEMATESGVVKPMLEVKGTESL